MAEYTALAPLFTDIANAIRSKTGETGQITANQFPQEINNISFDDKYLKLSGGTMTGNLILNGAPTADNQAATKAYVDGKGGGSVTLAEGAVTVGTSDTIIQFDVDISDILSHPNITLLLHCSGASGIAVCYVRAQPRIDTSDLTTALSFSVPSSGAVLSLPLAAIPKGASASTIALSFVANSQSYYIYSGQLGTTITRNNLYLKSNTGTFTAQYKIIMI